MPSTKKIARNRTVLRIMAAFTLDLLGISVAMIALGYEVLVTNNVSPGLGWSQILLCAFGIWVTVFAVFFSPTPRTWQRILSGKAASILAGI